MPSPSAEPALEPADLGLLFDIADASIANGLQGRPPRLPDVAALPEPLRRKQHAFVTLTVDGALNGCIGDIEGDEPLARAVAHHAWAAAFTDPRLPPLRPEEYERLLVEISLLSDMVPVAAASRDELLAVLRPHIDGLVVSALGRRALFLPAVWEQLPDAAEFLRHLKTKAGLGAAHWSDGFKASRFTATEYHEA